ncbi:MAG: Ig-like domain-containing protein [Actinomycetota bacterium]|nr:Ig-like domain-containing protein [Actinomycetota bacterium]
MIKRLVCLGSLALAACLGLTTTAAGHELDHPAPGFAPTAPPSPAFLSSPAGKWELVATIPTGNPHTDLDFFTRGKEIYASVGTLAVGPNAGGQTIVRLTNNGNVTPSSPQFVSSHPSAACASDPSRALGLQHDVEATPKGDVIFNTRFPSGVEPVRADAQLILDATDAKGRCHDAATIGVLGSDAQGGIEIVDITDIENPVEIALTSHIGQAHTVNVDPKRPHIAFVVTSDTVGVTCNADDSSCTRNNGLNLDGFEVLDFSTCMNFSVFDSVDFKRLTCRPQVYRYRYPSALIALGHTVDALAGCHELEIYPDDRLTCASINASIVFDLSGAFDDRGTPGDYTDDKPRGTPLPCRVRNSTTSGPFTTGAKVVDCVDRDPVAPGNDLDLANYTASSLEGVVHLGTAFHQGRGGPNNATADVDVSHEAELSGSGRLLLVTDERGGGVTPPGATCVTSPADNPSGNGGIHAYRMDSLLTSSPNDPAVAWGSYAQKPGGGKAIYRAPINTGPQASLCTAHVFQQIPGQNRIFMGWYTQGTQVVDFVEHPDGTVEFKQAGYFIPANANTWTSAVFKMKENGDGSFTYWGATGDFFLGAAGRSAIDIWKVTLPAPPKPFGEDGDGNGAPGDATTGGGWLADSSGKKINFGFHAKAAGSGFQGSLQLNDKSAGVKIHLSQVIFLGPVGPVCGSVLESDRSLEFRGTGSFNGQSGASFRVCVQDNGEPGSSSTGQDLFFLTCSFGCTYDTGTPTPDDAVDGGNIQVRRQGGSGGAGVSTLILDPLLLTTASVGQTQLFTVTAYDGNQNPLADASVTLTRTTASGVQTLTAVTGPLGIATLPVIVAPEKAEYVATAGTAQSNAVELAPGP